MLKNKNINKRVRRVKERLLLEIKATSVANLGKRTGKEGRRMVCLIIGAGNREQLVVAR